MASSTRARHLAEPVLVFVIVLCGYLLTASNDLRHNGDTYLRYQTTQALVDHHRAWIADPAWRDTRVALGRGNHLYAFYAPGQALMMAPLYVAGKIAAHHLHLPYDLATLYSTRSVDLWLGAILVVIFYAFCSFVGYGRAVSSILALILAFATVLWPDAQSALEQTQMTLFVTLAALALWRFVDSGLRTRRLLLLCGTAIGLAILTRYDALLYVPLMFGYVAGVRWWRHELSSTWADGIAFVAGAAPWLAAVAAWDTLRFGSPFLTGLHEQTLGEPFFQGLAGLVISPGKGLVWYLPLIVLLPFAVRPFFRRNPALGVLCTLLIVLPVLFYSNVLYWHGDPAWGPRYLYTAVPFLMLPLGELLVRWRRLRPSLKTATLVLILGSFALNLAAVSVTTWRFWFRLEATLQSESAAATWSGQPFHWGAQHYHYYWIPRESPILMQIDNLYQIGRLQILGDRQYLLTGHPDPYTATSPADNYSINTLAFWWTDVRHPLLGQRTRSFLALMLAGVMAAAMALLALRLRAPPAAYPVRVQEPERSAYQRAGT